MAPSSERPRLLIFVIAYYAEATLKRTLERIPESIFQDFDCEVLVVDDASQDRTFEIGKEYKAAHPEIHMTVLRNELNQGYGGNQKVGYAHAISEGFDFVAMVHGDGQYAPEQLPNLMAPLVADEADAVFGSRMMTRFGALKGGMPLYKFVGNRILTTAQNALLGTHLSEFHTGYRIYRTKTLENIQFELNSNDFHFDTEIIIQLINAHARIMEKPIPTFYGDEISRVNGMKYARDVMMATLRNAAHRAGLLHQRKFDTKRQEKNPLELKLGYPSSHTLALQAVPAGAKVLEVSTAESTLLAPLLAEKGCDVTVLMPPKLGAVETGKRKELPYKVAAQNLDQPLTVDVRPYDVILLLDVLEKLRSPERFLEDLRKQFGYEKKTIILTVPNVAFFVPRFMLLFGQFNQGKVGILDATHIRHFTYRSVRRLLADTGMKLKRVRGVPAPFPRVFGPGHPLSKLGLLSNDALIALSKTLFSYQVFVEAETTPDVWFVLKDSRTRASARSTSRKPRAPSRSK